jgi:hypothetical protein
MGRIIDTRNVSLALHYLALMMGAMNEYGPIALNHWRHGILLFLVLGSFVLMMSLVPIPQDPAYHQFIDTRALFGIRNFYNVISNLPFLLVGISGLLFSIMRLPAQIMPAWLIFFAGMILVCIGSAYYHLNPNNQTLVWDRLPMTMGFMGLFTALLGEFVDESLAKYGLLPLILVGLSSVLVWYWFDDLRFYVWVQFMPLLVIPAMLFLCRSRYTHSYLLILALIFYALAKMLEAFDADIFLLFHDEMSGHAMKHIFAAVGSAMILQMLRVRKPVDV